MFWCACDNFAATDGDSESELIPAVTITRDEFCVLVPKGWFVACKDIRCTDQILTDLTPYCSDNGSFSTDVNRGTEGGCPIWINRNHSDTDAVSFLLPFGAVALIDVSGTITVIFR